MDEQLKPVAEAANTVGDVEEAQRVNAMRKPIGDLSTRSAPNMPSCRRAWMS